VELSGVVLAGGASRRMGLDKRGMAIGGIPMLRRTLETVAGVVDQLIVVEHSERPIDRRWVTGIDARVVHDLRAGGPLAGIEAGLRATRTAWALVVGGDMPWVRAEVLHLLRAEAARADPGIDVVAIASRPDVAEPLLAAYRQRVLGDVSRALDAGNLRLSDLLATVRVRRLPPDLWQPLDPERRSVRNVNTPEDRPG
jgi:molybdenum cofactor guanylyltransferase